jgi:hypothetical protein
VNTSALIHLDVIVRHPHDTIVDSPASPAYAILCARLPERRRAVEAAVQQPPRTELPVDPLHATKPEHIGKAHTFEENGIVVCQRLDVESVVVKSFYEAF